MQWLTKGELLISRTWSPFGSTYMMWTSDSELNNTQTTSAYKQSKHKLHNTNYILNKKLRYCSQRTEQHRDNVRLQTVWTQTTFWTRNVAIANRSRVGWAHRVTAVNKSPSKVTQDHRKCHGSIQRICFPVHYIVTSLSCVVTRIGIYSQIVVDSGDISIARTPVFKVPVGSCPVGIEQNMFITGNWWRNYDENDDMLSRFDTIAERDGRTELLYWWTTKIRFGQTDRHVEIHISFRYHGC